MFSSVLKDLFSSPQNCYLAPQWTVQQSATLILLSFYSYFQALMQPSFSFFCHYYYEFHQFSFKASILPIPTQYRMYLFFAFLYTLKAMHISWPRRHYTRERILLFSHTAQHALFSLIQRLIEMLIREVEKNFDCQSLKV